MSGWHHPRVHPGLRGGWFALLILVLGSMADAALAQVLSFPSHGDQMQSSMSIGALQAAKLDFDIFTINSRSANAVVAESPSASISQLDLRAPGKARREYAKGFQLLMGRDYTGALQHLGNAAKIYPKFVAAHNALGSSYMAMDKNEEAREEFDKAVTLDDHLPNSYLNLGCAELALKRYTEAEEALRRASSIAPLDQKLHIALAYGEFLNRDYPAVLETARQVHAGKHSGAALVHYFAAAAWGAQDDLPQAQHEMETLLLEDPKSESATNFRGILQGLKEEQVNRSEAKLHPVQRKTVTNTISPDEAAREARRQAQQGMQDAKEQSEIVQAEAAEDAKCENCGAVAEVRSSAAAATMAESNVLARQPAEENLEGMTLRATVDEVSIFFAATNHRKSVTDLVASDVEVRDDHQDPKAILGFRNVDQLPLRLGLVIDTSNSVTSRFAFEQGAATKFVQQVVTGKDDLGFIVGVNNSVLLVQDFTGEPTRMTHAINQLAPGGGTALWDAVAFAAGKLSSRSEDLPVARVLVVVSDGKDNSSDTSLKDAIAAAQRSEVAIYTMSTRETLEEDSSSKLGDHALATLSEFTGGAAFVPGSLRNLNSSLSELQQVIRSRYMVSYKPKSFERNGKYRTIEISAKKRGQQLKIYARKGYYASEGREISSVTP